MQSGRSGGRVQAHYRRAASLLQPPAPRPSTCGAAMCRHPRVLTVAAVALAACTQPRDVARATARSEEHTSELQSQFHLVCRLLLEKKKTEHKTTQYTT